MGKMVVDRIEAARRIDAEMRLPELDLTFRNQDRGVVRSVEVPEEVDIRPIIEAMRDGIEAMRRDASGRQAIADACAGKALVCFSNENRSSAAAATISAAALSNPCTMRSSPGLISGSRRA
jgi:hypothetical protein